MRAALSRTKGLPGHSLCSRTAHSDAVATSREGVGGGTGAPCGQGRLPRAAPGHWPSSPGLLLSQPRRPRGCRLVSVMPEPPAWLPERSTRLLQPPGGRAAGPWALPTWSSAPGGLAPWQVCVAGAPSGSSQWPPKGRSWPGAPRLPAGRRRRLVRCVRSLACHSARRWAPAVCSAETQSRGRVRVSGRVQVARPGQGPRCRCWVLGSPAGRSARIRASVCPGGGRVLSPGPPAATSTATPPRPLRVLTAPTPGAHPESRACSALRVCNMSVQCWPDVGVPFRRRRMGGKGPPIPGPTSAVLPALNVQPRLLQPFLPELSTAVSERAAPGGPGLGHFQCEPGGPQEWDVGSGRLACPVPRDSGEAGAGSV